jgi:hypothetical protein
MRYAAGNYILTPKRTVKTCLVIDDEMAEVVRRIFELYAYEHQSPEAITKQLNTGKFDLNSPAARRDWNLSTI